MIVGLSVSFRNVCGVSERGLGRAPGGVCSLGLHLVWCPKYRGRVVGGLLERVAGERGWQVVAKEVLPDHVRVFVRVGPTDAPAAVVRAFPVQAHDAVRQRGVAQGR